MTSFCDWSADERRCSMLEVAAQRCGSCNGPPPETRGVPALHPLVAVSTPSLRAPAPQPTAGAEVPHGTVGLESIVVVDVADKAGVHRTIEVRANDDVLQLAKNYASSIPGGLSERQLDKLVRVLHGAALQHFGDGSSR